jgi:hypothetical protein
VAVNCPTYRSNTVIALLIREGTVRHGRIMPTPSSAHALSAPPEAFTGSPASTEHGFQRRGLSYAVDSPEDSGDSQRPPKRDGSGIPEDQRTKRRKTGPGSRGVANLTPEQLAKKRANGNVDPCAARSRRFQSRARLTMAV